MTVIKLKHQQHRVRSLRLVPTLSCENILPSFYNHKTELVIQSSLKYNINTKRDHFTHLKAPSNYSRLVLI